MKIQSKLIYMVLGAIVGAALLFGAVATFAQSDTGANSSTQADDGSTTTPSLPFGLGQHGIRPDRLGDDKEALATALGISVDELDAAQSQARTAAINQAVADGLITQAQADEMLANGFGGHGLGEMDTYLAEALGISVEELRTALDQVFADRLASMVSDGTITQEQADLIQARRSVQEYVDVEALQATIQSAYEDAVNQALSDGVITQAQADTLLSNSAAGGPGFDGPGFGGPGLFGGHHHGGPGGFGGPGFAPNGGNNSDTGSDA